MKELSIEEKAKAYDEAIEKFGVILNLNTVKESGTIFSDDVRKIFPELSESEDEKIRKEIIALIEWSKSYTGSGITTDEANEMLAYLENQGERKSTDKIQIGKEYKCIASPRYSTFMTGKIYKPEDKFLCNFMNFCSDCFEPIEDSEQIDLTSNTDKVEPKFKSGDIIHCKLDNRTFVIKEVDLKKGVYIYTEKGCGNDINYADEMFELVEPNPYTGTSFEYNNHTWGMCARDGGVEILFDGELKAFISLEKSFIYPVHPQPTLAPKSALEAVKEEEVNNANKNKVESDFNVGDWVVSPMGVYWHIDAIRDGRYQVTSDSGVSVDWPLNTKLYHRFTIQDAEDGDVLVSGEVVFIFKTIHGVWLNCYCSVHKDGSLNMDSYDLLTNKYFGEVYPSTKEQRDILMKAITDAGYEWDADKKELYPPYKFEVNKHDRKGLQQIR